jgi:hypothetical protein
MPLIAWWLPMASLRETQNKNQNKKRKRKRKTKKKATRSDNRAACAASQVLEQKLESIYLRDFSQSGDSSHSAVRIDLRRCRASKGPVPTDTQFRRALVKSGLLNSASGGDFAPRAPA